jgi:ABC-type antimicrobial peptide transport system permease subunit
MGVPLLRGRDFTRDDYRITQGASVPTIISHRIAEELWPGEDPLGRIITLWAGQTEQPGEVLAVVGDMRERGIEAGPTFAVYFPFMSPGWTPELVVHTSDNPAAVVPALRSILQELDPDTPLTDVATLDEMLGRSVGSHRFLMALVSLFAALALLLALAGVYGVQSYSVAQQTPEIGVRVAIGADKRQILKRVMAQAMGPAMLGIVLGLGGALALSRLIAGLLFQVEASDPVTYGGVASILAVAALVSAWLPALRATRVDPVIAFRAE